MHVFQFWCGTASGSGGEFFLFMCNLMIKKIFFYSIFISVQKILIVISSSTKKTIFSIYIMKCMYLLYSYLLFLISIPMVWSNCFEWRKKERRSMSIGCECAWTRELKYLIVCTELVDVCVGPRLDIRCTSSYVMDSWDLIFIEKMRKWIVTMWRRRVRFWMHHTRALPPTDVTLFNIYVCLSAF